MSAAFDRLVQPYVGPVAGRKLERFGHRSDYHRRPIGLGEAARASTSMTAAQALAFVERHGVVLVSAKGPVPRVTEAIAGEPIRGSWWAHPKSHHIYAVLQALSASPDVLVCRLVGGKVTLVHRRLWPALVKVAARFAPNQIAQVREEHTPSGHHATSQVAFPDWVADDVREKAKVMSEEEALRSLGAGVDPSCFKQRC